MKLSKYIDHTLLKPDATKEELKQLCKEAIEYDFKSVCVNSSNISICKLLLANSGVLICSVVGFPLGAMSTDVKTFETNMAIRLGANEIDMVINIGRLKDKDYNYIINEIKRIKEVCGGRVLKVIIETCLLTDEEITKACECVVKGGADYVKTSTGFSKSGATFEVVKLMKQAVGTNCKVKAAGGVRSHDDMLKYISLGVDRIGTSSGTKLISKGEEI